MASIISTTDYDNNHLVGSYCKNLHRNYKEPETNDGFGSCRYVRVGSPIICPVCETPCSRFDVVLFSGAGFEDGGASGSSSKKYVPGPPKYPKLWPLS